jgi:DNA-binding transcriptional regulator YdaS (Cro superfamily)
MRTHPLKNWLDDAGETPEAFANRIGRSASHIYNLLKGHKSAGAEVGYQIEDATGGSVTHREMYEWYSAAKSERRADGQADAA